MTKSTSSFASLNPLRLILFLLFAIANVYATAQEIKIASFTNMETDVTALTSGARIDQSGNKCALIKVASTLRDLRFDVGTLGIVDIEYQNDTHPAEIYLYVPAGVKKISIQHPRLGSIYNYDLGMTLKPAKVYLLELTGNQVDTFVVDYSKEKTLRTQVTPQNAQLFINGTQQPRNGTGIFESVLALGSHKYRVSAPDYYPEEGTIKIDDTAGESKLAVNLRPAFGFLSVTSKELAGGNIWLDDTQIGTVPLTRYQLKHGNYKVEVTHKYYLPYSETITIRDNETTNFVPQNEGNFGYAKVVIDDPKAEIYIDNEYVDKSAYNGYKLVAGEHTIEARRDLYKGISKRFTVHPDQTQTCHLPALQAKVGSLKVTATPADAEVWIDGIYAGKPGATFDNLFIGSHYIEIKLDGYGTIAKNVEIREDVEEQIFETLSSTTNFSIYSDPRNAQVNINGYYAGLTPCVIKKAPGKYELEITEDGYKTISKTINIDANTKDMFFKMKREYKSKLNLYAFGGYTKSSDAPNGDGFNVGIGGYLNHVNIEAEYFGYSTNDSQIDNGAIKIGWGTMLNDNFRLTPHIGLGFAGGPTDGNNFAIAGAKLEWIISPDIALYTTADFNHFLEYSWNRTNFNIGVKLSPKGLLYTTLGILGIALGAI